MGFGQIRREMPGSDDEKPPRTGRRKRARGQGGNRCCAPGRQFAGVHDRQRLARQRIAEHEQPGDYGLAIVPIFGGYGQDFDPGVAVRHSRHDEQFTAVAS